MPTANEAAHAIARAALIHARRTCKTDDEPTRAAKAILTLSHLVEAFIRLGVFRRLQLKDALLQANGAKLKDVEGLGGFLSEAHTDVLRLLDELGIPQTEL